MKSLDTNILVRFLTGDDAEQSKKVLSIFRTAQENGERFHVSQLVILELIWLLESAYKYRREEILLALEKMAALPIFSIENPTAMDHFITVAHSGRTELSDLLIGTSAASQNCETTLTFDKKAAKETKLFRLMA